MAGWSGLICGVWAGWAAAGLRAGNARGDCPLHEAGVLLSLGIVKAIGVRALAVLSALLSMSQAPLFAVLSPASCLFRGVIPGVWWLRCCCAGHSLLARIGVICTSALAEACMRLGRTDGWGGDNLLSNVGVRSRECTLESPDIRGSF